MNKKKFVIGMALAVALGGSLYLGLDRLGSKRDHDGVQKELAVIKEKKNGPQGEAPSSHRKPESVAMSPEKQKQNGVIIAAAAKERLPGVISVTGKIEVNADRIAHVSPRIPGKITAVRASLGDSVAAGQILVVLDSVELGEAINRYQQSKTKLALLKSNLERVRALVEKKIAARKEILQAETEYETTLSALHTDEERLLLYGLPASELEQADHKRQLLPVRSPIGGIVTEKHAIVGELADPSKSLYTVADLSSVWVMVDIHEKDLAKINRGMPAVISVGAFPDIKFKGRINHIADMMDESTRTVKARVSVPNTTRKLKPEMFATVELALASDASPVLAVPQDALQDLDGGKVLFVTEDGTSFMPRPVQAGRTANGKVEVREGLREGERYAIKGAFMLKSELKKAELMGDEH